MVDAQSWLVVLDNRFQSAVQEIDRLLRQAALAEVHDLEAQLSQLSAARHQELKQLEEVLSRKFYQKDAQGRIERTELLGQAPLLNKIVLEPTSTAIAWPSYAGRVYGPPTVYWVADETRQNLRLAIIARHDAKIYELAQELHLAQQRIDDTLLQKLYRLKSTPFREWTVEDRQLIQGWVEEVEQPTIT